MILPTLPPRTGVGFKPEHFDGLNADPGPVGFVEVHAENYIGDGGLPRQGNFLGFVEQDGEDVLPAVVGGESAGGQPNPPMQRQTLPQWPDGNESQPAHSYVQGCR